jgi:hypothetical protein
MVGSMVALHRRAMGRKILVDSVSKLYKLVHVQAGEPV